VLTGGSPVGLVGAGMGAGMPVVGAGTGGTATGGVGAGDGAGADWGA
jgi:hypothetical protein